MDSAFGTTRMAPKRKKAEKGNPIEIPFWNASPTPIPPSGGPSSDDQSEQESISSISTPQFSPFCSRDNSSTIDQIPEATADWFAVEVLTAYMHKYHSELGLEDYQRGYSNIFRGSYPAFEVDDSGQFGDTHPSLKARINRLLLANPIVRSDLQCPETIDEPMYCPSGFRNLPIEQKIEVDSSEDLRSN